MGKLFSDPFAWFSLEGWSSEKTVYSLNHRNGLSLTLTLPKCHLLSGSMQMDHTIKQLKKIVILKYHEPRTGSVACSITMHFLQKHTHTSAQQKAQQASHLCVCDHTCDWAVPHRMGPTAGGWLAGSGDGGDLMTVARAVSLWVTLVSQLAMHLDTGCLTCRLWTWGFSGSSGRWSPYRKRLFKSFYKFHLPLYITSRG